MRGTVDSCTLGLRDFSLGKLQGCEPGKAFPREEQFASLEHFRQGPLFSTSVAENASDDTRKRTIFSILPPE